tara:strand:- start:40 stop:522 length:483 start_codon:yes stop_codon:yes gene_type:complete
MEKQNFNKLEIKKVWNAMKDAGIIEKEVSSDEEGAAVKRQHYNLKTALKIPGATGQYLMKTLIFSLNQIQKLNEDFEEMDKNHEETIRELEEQLTTSKQQLHKACSEVARLTHKIKSKEYTIECNKKSHGELIKRNDLLKEQIGMNEPKPYYDPDSDLDE